MGWLKPPTMAPLASTASVFSVFWGGALCPHCSPTNYEGSPNDAQAFQACVRPSSHFWAPRLEVRCDGRYGSRRGHDRLRDELTTWRSGDADQTASPTDPQGF